MDGASAGHHGPFRCIVVGASARGFAESAARSGWTVHAADLFGDADLQAAACETVRIAGTVYPNSIPLAIGGFPIAPVAYTGALENHPDVIEALARDRPLAGCGAAAVRRVRDPAQLATAVRDAGFRFPDTFSSPEGLPTDGTFLVKPRASAGGRGIMAWRGAAAAAGRRDVHWQQFVPGEPWSAAWIAGGGVSLVGASRPLRGGSWCGARRFAYCGSLDEPVGQLPDRLRRSFESLGAGLAAAFGLVGAFGCDLIVDGAGMLHVLEVNPRPTASLELVERSTGWSIASVHLAACGWGRAAPAIAPGNGGLWAKAIVYAPGPLASVSLRHILAATDAWTQADGMAAVADVPAADVPVAPGAPLITVFARGPTRAAVAAELRARVRRVRNLAAGDVSPRADARPRSLHRRGRTA